MAITDLQLSEELTAGAPSIKYEGDMRPQTQMNQMQEIEGQMAGPQWWWDRVQHLEYLGYSHEEAGQIAMDSSAYYDIVGYPGEFAQGGEVRQAYGLGKLVKKIGKGIKKVVDNPFVQSALMLNPATAPYAMTYQGLRGLKQGDPMGALMAYQGMSGANTPAWMKGVNKYSKGLGYDSYETENEKDAYEKGQKSNRKPSSGWFDTVRDALFYKKGTQDIDPLKVAIGAGAGLLGIGALQKRANEKEPKLADIIGDRGSKIGLDDIQIKVQAAIDSGDKATYENLRTTENLAFLPPWESIKRADGGRIGYAAGGQTSAEMLQMIEKLRAEGKTELEIQQILQQMFRNRMSFPRQGIPSINTIPRQGMSGPANFIDTVITETGAGGQMPTTTDVASIRDNASIMKPVSGEVNTNMSPDMMRMGAMKRLPEWRRDATEVPQSPQQPLPEISPYQAAQGGRIGYDNGGPIDPGYLGIPPIGLGTGLRPGGNPYPSLDYYDKSQGTMKKRNKKNKKNKQRRKKAEGGLMSLDGMEMDLRGGGFVPIGAQEKADDVPARLSKNEFVFTADAVRAAGDGDVDRGADKMYNTMKQLENRVA